MKFYKITFYRIQMLQVHSTLLLLALLNLLTLGVNRNCDLIKSGRNDKKQLTFYMDYIMINSTEHLFAYGALLSWT